MRRLARVLFWLSLAAIAFATLGPIDVRPESGLPAPFERLGAFLLVSVLLSLAYPRYRGIGWVALVGVAALLEMLQNAVPGRHGRVVDFDLKAVGVVLGALLGLALARARRPTPGKGLTPP